MHRNADCVGGAACVNGSCGPKPPGRGVQRRRRLRVGLLRDGRLLRDAPATARADRARSPAARDSHRGPGRRRPDEPVRGRGRVQLRARRHLRRRGRVPPLRRAAPCAVAASCSGAMSMPARTCNGGGTCLMVVPASCGAYTCEAAGDVCRTACAAVQRRLLPPGDACMNGACVPPSNPTGGAGGSGGAGSAGRRERRAPVAARARAPAGGSASGGGGGASAGSGGANGGRGGSAGTGSGGRRPVRLSRLCLLRRLRGRRRGRLGVVGGTWSVIADGGAVYRGANGSGNSSLARRRGPIRPSRRA